MVFDQDPFAILTAVVAPAVLTNACSVLSQSTSNRIARVVDRSRALMGLPAAEKALKGESYDRELKILRVRANLLLNSLRLFYIALAMFAATALIAIFGSIFIAFDMSTSFNVTAVFGLLVGSVAVIGTVAGCALMMRETHLAIRALTEEHLRG